LLLLEEPELSLNAAIVQKLPSLMYRIQRQKKRQIILTTHSADLLEDKGIGGEEILLLTPSLEGTKVTTASSIDNVRDLLEGGLSIAEAVLPLTKPSEINQLEIHL
ncbi:MAG: AAA family ATPase, partial [Dolichospermum sp.]